MTLTLNLTAAPGVIDLGFAVFHLLFWKLLGWPQSLEASGKLNSAVTRTLNLVLIYVFVVYGVALIWLGENAPPGLLIAGAGFWVLRAVLQPVMFEMKTRLSGALLGAFVVAAVFHGLAAVAGAQTASGLGFAP